MVTLVAAGTLVSIANNATGMNLTVPTFTYDAGAGQFLRIRLQKNAVGFTLSAPVGWTQVYQNDWDPVSGREHTVAAFVRAATGSDSGATIAVSQGAAGGFTVFSGVIDVWQGADTSNLLDATAAAVSENEPSDNVTFPAYDPASTDCTLFADAYYGEDQTTFAASFGTPTLTLVAATEYETATGTDQSIATATANSTGSAVSAGNTWATASTIDNASTGVLYAIRNQPAGGGSPVSVTVPVASLALTGFAPTAAATNHVAVTVPASSLTLQSFAPTVVASAHVEITVPAASLTLTGFAPSVSVGAAVAVQVPAASLSLTGHAPTVEATGHVSVTVPTATLTLASFAPDVGLGPLSVVVPGAALTLTGYAPSVSVASPSTRTLHARFFIEPVLHASVEVEPTLRGTVDVEPVLFATSDLQPS